MRTSAPLKMVRIAWDSRRDHSNSSSHISHKYSLDGVLLPLSEVLDNKIIMHLKTKLKLKVTNINRRQVAILVVIIMQIN